MENQKRIPSQRYVNAKQSAQILGVSPATFQIWRRRHVYIDQFEPKQIGARTYYNASRLKKFRKEYVPHARLANVPHAPAIKADADIPATLDLILDVLCKLERTITRFKVSLH